MPRLLHAPPHERPLQTYLYDDVDRADDLRRVIYQLSGDVTLDWHRGEKSSCKCAREERLQRGSERIMHHQRREPALHSSPRSIQSDG